MIWRVLLFAHLREKHGMEVQVEAEPSVASVLEAVQALGIDKTACRLAADNEFVKTGDSLRPGAELALIPPVSGG